MDRAAANATFRRRKTPGVKLPEVLLLLVSVGGCRGPMPGGPEPAAGRAQVTESPRDVGSLHREEKHREEKSASTPVTGSNDLSGKARTTGEGGLSENGWNAPAWGGAEPTANAVSFRKREEGGDNTAVAKNRGPDSAVAPVTYAGAGNDKGSGAFETAVVAEPIVPTDRDDLEGLPQSPAGSQLEEPTSPSRLPEPTAAAGDRQPDRLSELISTALARHPRIQAARRRVAAAANEIPQARALPDPMLNNTFWPIEDHALQTAAGRVGHQMGINQQVPWPAKLDSRAAIAARDVEVAQAEVEEIEKEIVESVQLAYYELWFAQRAVEIVEDNQELVDDLKQVSEARYRAGGTQQDILRAELEADKLEDQLIELRRRTEQARADLGALVRQPADLMPEPTIELPSGVTRVQLMELIAEAERCNPTLRGLAAEIARDREKQRLAYLQKYPDLQFGVGWTLVTEEDSVSPVANGHDNVNFTLGVTLPIWKDKIAAGIREAANRSASTAQLREAERDRLYGELRRLVAAAQAAIEQTDLFEQRLIPRTEQTLSLATADYRGERTDFFNLIDIYRELLTYQMQLARARATLAGTIAEIERAAGCSLMPTLKAEPTLNAERRERSAGTP